MENIILAILLILLVGVVIFLKRRPKKLTKAACEKYENELRVALTQDPSLGYISIDRILEHILSDLYGQGTLANNLKKYNAQHASTSRNGGKFPSKAGKYYIEDSLRNKLWKFHNVRNRLVHEGGVTISKAQVEEFARVVREIFL